MTGYCISDKYCRYKSDTGYCGYTGGCVLGVLDNTARVDIPTERSWPVTHVVDISTDSIEAIADAVVRKLRGEQDVGSR